MAKANINSNGLDEDEQFARRHPAGITQISIAIAGGAADIEEVLISLAQPMLSLRARVVIALPKGQGSSSLRAFLIGSIADRNCDQAISNLNGLADRLSVDELSVARSQFRKLAQVIGGNTDNVSKMQMLSGQSIDFTTFLERKWVENANPGAVHASVLLCAVSSVILPIVMRPDIKAQLFQARLVISVPESPGQSLNEPRVVPLGGAHSRTGANDLIDAFARRLTIDKVKQIRKLVDDLAIAMRKD
jgi:hypothetical protein